MCGRRRDGLPELLMSSTVRALWFAEAINSCTAKKGWCLVHWMLRVGCMLWFTEGFKPLAIEDEPTRGVSNANGGGTRAVVGQSSQSISGRSGIDAPLEDNGLFEFKQYLCLLLGVSR